MQSIKRILPAVLLTLSLCGCAALFGTTDEDIQKYNEPRFNTEEPIKLKVNKIDVKSEFTPSFTRPNVEHLFPVSIEKTAKNWAKDRLEAADFSSNKIAEVIIRDASVTEEPEKSDQKDFFSKERVKYRATLNVVVKVIDPENLSRAETEVEAWRELIIPADTENTEKEQYWNGMVTKLFNDFNAKMTANIHQYLNMHIVDGENNPTYY